MKTICLLLFQCTSWLYPPRRSWVQVLLLASAIELVLLAVHPGGFWWNTNLGWVPRLEIATSVVLNWLVIGWFGWWLGQLFISVGHLPGAKWVAVALIPPAWGIVSFLYLASWVFYWRVGIFPDLDALRFVLVNSTMIWKYLWQTERMLVLLCGGAIIFITSGSYWHAMVVLRTHRPVARSSQGLGFRGLIVILVACDLVWLAAEFQGPRWKTEAGRSWWHQQGPSYHFEFCFRVNPTLTIITGELFKLKPESHGELLAQELGPPRLRESKQPIVPRNSRRRSVIIVAVESLRSDVVSLTHQGQEIMPNLNAIARSGRVFTRAYAQSTHSDYADPCIVSSLYPLRTEQHHYYSRSDRWPKVLIYDVLKPYGYATAIFSSQNETWGNMDIFLESQNLDVFFDSRSYDGPTYVAQQDKGFADYVADARVAGKLDDAVTMTQAIEWMREQHASQVPFFVYMPLQTSHFPYEIPVSRSGPFQPSKLDFEASFLAYPRDKVPIVRNAYYNALRYVDDQIGRLSAFLEQSRPDHEVILAIAGDNGEAFYENGIATHAGAPFEPAVHVSFIMHCPRVVEPGGDDSLVQVIDIAPTLLGLLEIPAPPAFQGIDVLAKTSSAPEERLAFVHCQTGLSESDAVISGYGWKYVHNRRKQTVNLHYLPSDPGERNNLVDRHPNVSEVLSKFLQDWRRRQLLYHQRLPYYIAFYAPRTPKLDADALATLRQEPKPD